ncbi:phosphoglycerate mutase-like protein [Saccharata proteae CBS 121410]|uniref:Phosphoglycerate mutase-like protein n=1 Tax=Saccharata proteae CBS 121410 TaxID=1314787 RepID=A0A9P4HYN2_9PEZI|nr:phosphoglycerate mutase-like protein [Saccharata proteae CBS 121410]
MRLFLIRHGETVDNVAGLYAGSRDSQLTNHGFQQAGRLGQHFRDTDVRLTHIFASPLQRARITAERIRDAQPGAASQAANKASLPITSSPLLKEQDFGFYEGKAFFERPHGSNKTGKQDHLDKHKDEPGFVDVESKDSMAERMDTFLREHILGLWQSDGESQEHVVAVVSHGIILSVLWRRILRHLPRKSVSLVPELMSSQPVSLEHLGGFSNTGFLELVMARGKDSDSADPALKPSLKPDDTKAAQENVETLTDSVPEDSTDARLLPQSPEAVPAQYAERIVPAPEVENVANILRNWTTTICVINGKEHLRNFKRTGGGVGSSAYNEGQKTIESFFKRRKVD